MPASPKMEETYTERSSFPAMEAMCEQLQIPYVRKPAAEWGLDARHFFGSKSRSPRITDWSHVNYPGSYVFSARLGELVARQLANPSSDAADRSDAPAQPTEGAPAPGG